MFYSCFRKFLVVENSFPIVTKLNKIDTKKKSETISIFVDFTLLYPRIPHNILIKVSSEAISFAFISKVVLVFQIHPCTVHCRVVEENTSQDKHWLVQSHFSSQNAILPFET